MVKKDFEVGFDRISGKTGSTPAADQKTGTETPPTFSARIEREVADLIRDYAYTKRISVGEALTVIVKKFFDDYQADPENEPLLNHKRRGE